MGKQKRRGSAGDGKGWQQHAPDIFTNTGGERGVGNVPEQLDGKKRETASQVKRRHRGEEES